MSNRLTKLTDHISNPVNDLVEITVMDDPGQGGANHRYRVKVGSHAVEDIKFQDGPINEHGVNGITQEVLIAIVLDRLRGFQSGQFKCRENACAITHLEEALMWLQKRTRDRIARGVEGTNKV